MTKASPWRALILFLGGLAAQGGFSTQRGTAFQGRFAVLSGLALLGGLAVPGTPAMANPLSGADIQSDIVGRQIFLAAPFGGEFPLNYRSNGVVDGSGEALGLGRFIKPSDRGKWWVRGDQLCQQFETWYDGARLCFRLTRLGPNRLRWDRDNGDSGTARIGSKLN